MTLQRNHIVIGVVVLAAIVAITLLMYSLGDAKAKKADEPPRRSLRSYSPPAVRSKTPLLSPVNSVPSRSRCSRQGFGLHPPHLCGGGGQGQDGAGARRFGGPRTECSGHGRPGGHPTQSRRDSPRPERNRASGIYAPGLPRSIYTAQAGVRGAAGFGRRAGTGRFAG